MTIQFRVDDLKCSHMDQAVLEDLVKQLNGMFRTSKKELSETKGDVHEYLGLTIDFSGKYDPKHPDKMGQVIFTMYDYIEDIIGSAPPDMNGIAPDPAKSRLLSVHENSPLLGVAQAEFFHSMTARLLSAAKQARPDIQVAVAYLCTRVREPTEDDYLKLARVILYLRATVHLPLIIWLDNTGELL